MPFHNWTVEPAYIAEYDWGQRRYYQGVPLTSNFNRIDNKNVWTGMAPIQAAGYKKMVVRSGHNTYSGFFGVRLGVQTTAISAGDYMYMRSSGWLTGSNPGVKKVKVEMVINDFIAGGSSNATPETHLVLSKTEADGWPNPRFAIGGTTSHADMGGDGVVKHGWRWSPTSMSGTVQLNTTAVAYGGAGGTAYAVNHISSSGPVAYSSTGKSMVRAFTTGQMELYSRGGGGDIGMNFWVHYADHFPYSHALGEPHDPNSYLKADDDEVPGAGASAKTYQLEPHNWSTESLETNDNYRRVRHYTGMGVTKLLCSQPYGHTATAEDAELDNYKASPAGRCGRFRQRNADYTPEPALASGESMEWKGKYTDNDIGWLMDPPDGVVIQMGNADNSASLHSKKATGTVVLTGVPAENATVTITGHGPSTYVPTGSDHYAPNPTRLAVVFKYNESDPSDSASTYVHKGDNANEAGTNIAAAINASDLNMTAVASDGGSTVTITSNWGFNYNNYAIAEAGDTGGVIAVTGMAGAEPGAFPTTNRTRLMCTDVIVDLIK
jgi:hypothetical protein